MADTMFQPEHRKEIRETGKTIDIDNLSAARKNRERIARAQVQETTIPDISERFRKLLDRHYRKNYGNLVGFISRRVPKERASDIVQEAYLKALEKSANFNPDKGRFSTWFKPILSQAASEINKAERLKGATYVPEGVLPEFTSLDELLKKSLDPNQEHYTELKLLERNIDREFKPASAAALKLSLLGQLPVKAVARRTGLTENSVKSLVKRYRQKLASL